MWDGQRSTRGKDGLRKDETIVWFVILIKYVAKLVLTYYIKEKKKTEGVEDTPVLQRAEERCREIKALLRLKRSKSNVTRRRLGGGPVMIVKVYMSFDGTPCHSTQTHMTETDDRQSPSGDTRKTVNNLICRCNCS